MNEKGKLEDHLRNGLSRSAYDLFVVFGRFEYAVKVGGFRRECNAEPAWRTFADRLPNRFFERMRDASQARGLFDQPA